MYTSDTRTMSAVFLKLYPIHLPTTFCSTQFARIFAALSHIFHFIKRNRIQIGFGFDQPVFRPSYPAMRLAGMKSLFSYWGASMSSMMPDWKLFLKKLQVALTPAKPDSFIFESKACADTAIYGRGVNEKRVHVVNPGIEATTFINASQSRHYAHDVFNICKEKKIIVYSGHMEDRKGVDVLIKAIVRISRMDAIPKIHCLILGNKGNEHHKFQPLFENTPAGSMITFGGYREDIAAIFNSSYLAVLPSKGWDSWTISSVEMAASGLPILASDLQGLKEAVIEGKTGFHFPPGDFVALSNLILMLLIDQTTYTKISLQARNRVLNELTSDHQISNLVKIVSTATSSSNRRCFSCLQTGR